MAKVSSLGIALRGAAVAGLLFVSVAPSQAGWLQRFSALRGGPSASMSYGYGFQWPWLVQYRAYRYDQRLSWFFGRPVSPFCRIFCGF